MYVKISNPKVYIGNNAVGSSDAIKYLDKENAGKPLQEKEFFFNQFSDSIPNHKAEQMLDNINKQGLKKTDAKFYMLTINPSAKELEHIGNNKEAFKAYVLNVMDEYAKNFNREIDGKSLDINDLNFFAKIETERHFKYYDKAVQNNEKIKRQIKELKKTKTSAFANRKEIQNLKNQLYRLEGDKIQKGGEGKIIKQGMTKPGLNMHAHVLVSRKDLKGKAPISPFAPARKTKEHTVNGGKKIKMGFSRDQFYERAEHQFDKQFKYERDINEHYKYHNLKKNHKQTYRKVFQRSGKNYAEKTVEKLMKNVANEFTLGFINKLNAAKMATAPAKVSFNAMDKMTHGVVSKHMSELKKYINPSKLPLTIVKEGIKAVER